MVLLQFADGNSGSRWFHICTGCICFLLLKYKLCQMKFSKMYLCSYNLTMYCLCIIVFNLLWNETHLTMKLVQVWHFVYAAFNTHKHARCLGMFVSYCILVTSMCLDLLWSYFCIFKFWLLQALAVYLYRYSYTRVFVLV